MQTAGSPASRASVLHPGDVLLEIDGLDVHKAFKQDVTALLKVSFYEYFGSYLIFEKSDVLVK